MLADLTRRQYQPLVARLASRPRFRRVDPHLISDAVVEALMECVAGPRGGGGDPSPAGLRPESYLPVAAERNLLNLLRSEGRRKRRERTAAEAAAVGLTGEPVELHTPAGNTLGKEEADRQQRERGALLDLLRDPLDRRVLELQLDGERRTAAFAEALGLGHLTADEQRKAVKRVKDRIGTALRRAVRRGSPGADGAEADHG